MNVLSREYTATQAPYGVALPRRQIAPVVLASPHSGQWYPPSFLAVTRLDPISLRRSEDSFVDELFAGGPDLGVPLINALFARAFVDANREPFELDPEMYDDELPGYANARSPRVAAGLGTIARTVANGQPIYRRRLKVHEALSRIEACYRPYHDALRGLVEETRARFGTCLLVDCHSMPSNSMEAVRRGGKPVPSVDVVLGDAHGTSCSQDLVACAEQTLTELGYRVYRNVPYAGGFTTRHYGRPAERLHALQIELNRALYMDENRIARSARFKAVADDMSRLVAALAAASRQIAADRR
ncbi:MAG: N-formylglutamate amidohydrolase [Alphaproteobacteria bacterium]